MPEGHNRILLGPDTGRGIKENQGEIQRGDRKKESKSFHTHTTSFSHWWFCDLT